VRLACAANQQTTTRGAFNANEASGGQRHTIEQVVEVSDGPSTDARVALEKDGAVLVRIHALDVEGALVETKRIHDLQASGPMRSIQIQAHILALVPYVHVLAECDVQHRHGRRPRC
jgi:hypothetical protein